MSFDVLDLFLSCSLGYCILQLQLLVFGKGVKAMGVPLIVLLLMLCWIQLEFLAARNLWNLPQLLFGTQYGSWFFLGPSLYHYLNATIKGQLDRRAYGLQLIPGVLLAITVPLFVDDVIPQRAVDYGMLTILAYPKLGYTPGQAFYAIIFIAQFLYLFYFIIVSVGLLRDTEREMKSTMSNLFPIHVLRNLLLLMVLLMAGSTLFFYALLTSYQYYRYWDFFYALPFAFVTYYMVYKLNRYPQAVWLDLNRAEKGNKYEKSRLDPDILSNYVKRLENTVDQQKLYLRKDLTLKELGEEVNIKSHHLSQVFNQAMNTTFFDYINAYRVKEAQRLLRDRNRNILEVAMDSGFATKASFNKHFKSVTGMTPSQFMQQKHQSE